MLPIGTVRKEEQIEAAKQLKTLTSTQV